MTEFTASTFNRLGQHACSRGNSAGVIADFSGHHHFFIRPQCQLSEATVLPQP